MTTFDPTTIERRRALNRERSRRARARQRAGKRCITIEVNDHLLEGLPLTTDDDAEIAKLLTEFLVDGLQK